MPRKTQILIRRGTPGAYHAAIDDDRAAVADKDRREHIDRRVAQRTERRERKALALTADAAHRTAHGLGRHGLEQNITRTREMIRTLRLEGL